MFGDEAITKVLAECGCCRKCCQRFVGARNPALYREIQKSEMKELVEDDEEEPPNKRSRTEENLIPEEQFLARHSGPVTLSVAVPSVPDKPEWKLDGQMMSLTLPLTETVNTIKQRIMEELGMPQGKQKLQHENIFLKVIL